MRRGKTWFSGNRLATSLMLDKIKKYCFENNIDLKVEKDTGWIFETVYITMNHYNKRLLQNVYSFLRKLSKD